MNLTFYFYAVRMPWLLLTSQPSLPMLDVRVANVHNPHSACRLTPTLHIYVYNLAVKMHDLPTP